MSECSDTVFNCPCDESIYYLENEDEWDSSCDFADLCGGYCSSYVNCEKDSMFNSAGDDVCHRYINNCNCDPKFERAYLLLNGYDSKGILFGGVIVL